VWWQAVASSIQRVLFQSLFAKDMDWWNVMSQRLSSKELVILVMLLPKAVESALKKPQQLINAIISIAVQIQMVMANRSPTLLALMGLQWGSFAAEVPVYVFL